MCNNLYANSTQGQWVLSTISGFTASTFAPSSCHAMTHDWLPTLSDKFCIISGFFIRSLCIIHLCCCCLFVVQQSVEFFILHHHESFHFAVILNILSHLTPSQCGEASSFSA